MTGPQGYWLVCFATTPTNPIMNDQKYDFTVIGTSPGGEGAVMKAAKENPSVAVIHLHYFVNTPFNYPTLAEASPIAALNGSNRPA